MELLEEPGKKNAKIVNAMYWWLNRHRSFIVNDEYEIELIEIDKKRGTAKILVRNLKTNSQTVVAESNEDGTEQTV
jgi:hypothetical protein